MDDDAVYFNEIEPYPSWNDPDEFNISDYCKYGHYEESNPYLPECINERITNDH